MLMDFLKLHFKSSRALLLAVIFMFQGILGRKHLGYEEQLQRWGNFLFSHAIGLSRSRYSSPVLSLQCFCSFWFCWSVWIRGLSACPVFPGENNMEPDCFFCWFSILSAAEYQILLGMFHPAPRTVVLTEAKGVVAKCVLATVLIKSTFAVWLGRKLQSTSWAVSSTSVAELKKMS